MGNVANNRKRPVDWGILFDEISCRTGPSEYSANRTIFRQGQPADSLVLVAVRKGAKMAVHSGAPRRLCSGLGQWRQGQALRARYARP